MAILELDQTLYTITWFLAFVLYFSIELCRINGQVSRSETKLGEAFNPILPGLFGHSEPHGIFGTIPCYSFI